MIYQSSARKSSFFFGEAYLLDNDPNQLVDSEHEIRLDPKHEP